MLCRRNICARIADQVRDGYAARGIGTLAYVPVIFGGGYLGDQLAKFLRSIGAEAGDYPIEEQDERNYGEDVGEEQARPAEGANPRGEEEGEQRPKKHERDGDGGAAGDFENADGLAGVHGILQDGASFGGLEMVEGSEHGAEAAEFGRDFRGVHRSRMERDVILRSGTGGLEGVRDLDIYR